MPRRKRRARATAVASAFRQVQSQARSLLGNLHKQIRTKESELSRLKEEASRLGMLIGRQVGRPRAAAAGGGGGGGGRRGGRINWRVVLKQLPRQFKAADVRSIRGLKGKRPSEIFAAITRWINAGAAKRKARGMYEKTA
jgi:hypothetical protein